MKTIKNLEDPVCEVVKRCERDDVCWTSGDVGSTIKFKVFNEQVSLVFMERKEFNEVRIRSYKKPRKEFIKLLKGVEESKRIN